MGLWRDKKAPPSEMSLQASAGAVTRQRLMSATARAPIDRFEGWQQELDVYDEWGPGFVGSYLDLVSDKVARCDAQLIDEREGQPCGCEEIASIFNGVWSLWRGRYENRAELLKRHARLRTKHGECYIVRLPENRIAIAHKNELRWETGQGKVFYRDPVTEEWVSIELDTPGLIPNVWRSWTPLDRDPRLVQCELKRGLVHIREYINVKLRQDTDTSSPLVRNKILLFGAGTESYKNPDDPTDPRNGMPDAYVDYLNLAAKREQQQYHQRRRPQDSVPFPMLGDKLELFDMGRNSDPQSQILEDSAIYAFSRSVRVPIQYIHSGPGVAKYDNEAYVLESLIQDSIEPLANSILGDIWRIWMRPLMIITYSKMRDVSIQEAEFALRHYGMGPDTDRIRPKIDNVSNLREGYKLGAATREALAGSMDTQALELPEDMSEFEFWRLVNQMPPDVIPGADGSGAPPSDGGVAIPPDITLPNAPLELPPKA